MSSDPTRRSHTQHIIMPNTTTKTLRQCREQTKRTQRLNKYFQEVNILKGQLKKVERSIKEIEDNVDIWSTTKQDEQNYDATRLSNLSATERALTSKLHFYLNKIERNQ